MPVTHSFRKASRILALSLLPVLVVSAGCFRKKQPETAPPPPPAPVVCPECPPCPPPPPPEPDSRVPVLEERVRKLTLDLLTKESEVQDMEGRLSDRQGELDKAIQEVVRAKARLRSLESRAEAASQMAEAEIALEALEAGSKGSRQMELEQIRQLLAMSAEEFDKENFGGALFLSDQAKTRIQGTQMRLRARDEVETESGEVPFAVPLSLRVVKPTNLRERPGLGQKILATLAVESPVTGYSHKGEWVRVKAEDGTRGWIHQSLLAGR